MKDSFEILKDLPLADFVVVKSYDDLKKFDFPFFLKVDIGGHKSDIGGVLRCDNLNSAKENLRKMHKSFPCNHILAQESVEGIEMIVGLKKDKVFGKLLVVGFGGVFAEVRRDVSFRALPVSRVDVVSMVNELKGFDIFNSRGKKHNLEKFYTLVEKVAYLGDKIDIKELDLNPVVVGEKSSKIVDARIEIN